MGGLGSGGQNKTSPETEARLLEHVARVPGLTAHEIGRVVGVAPRTVEVTLTRLSQAGHVQSATEPCRSSPSGERRLWYSSAVQLGELS